MDKTKTLMFLVTGLCSLLEHKGLLAEGELAKHLENTLDDSPIPFSDADKDNFRQAIQVLKPIRIVDSL